jgi:hypothetical protein
MMTRFIALASLALLAACSSGADVADDAPANDSSLDAITGRAEERLEKAEKDADARASEAGADEPR